jgi:hypothetical protein
MPRRLVAATGLPVSGDFENGFGEAPEVVAETVRLSAEAGLAGISVEDTALPGAGAYPFELAVERIRAAAAAARALPRDFVLVARADGVMTGAYDLEEALAGASGPSTRPARIVSTCRCRGTMRGAGPGGGGDGEARERARRGAARGAFAGGIRAPRRRADLARIGARAGDAPGDRGGRPRDPGGWEISRGSRAGCRAPRWTGSSAADGQARHESSAG